MATKQQSFTPQWNPTQTNQQQISNFIQQAPPQFLPMWESNLPQQNLINNHVPLSTEFLQSFPTKPAKANINNGTQQLFTSTNTDDDIMSTTSSKSEVITLNEF